MPRQCCFLCASDEGVFLDITTSNKQMFHEQFEICSLIKVPADRLPAKLCHKCVYELSQCSSFVQRFKRSLTQRIHARKNYCSICLDSTKSKFSFDLSKDQCLKHSSFEKIQEVFNYDLKNSKEDHKLICLSCRYMLDVLSDLKNLSKKTAMKLNDVINEEIDYATFPKIKTIIVNRKTTITESARTDLSTVQKSNSDSVMTRSRSQNNKLSNNNSYEELKQQFCDKCHSSVKNGDSLYQVQKTKDTVCKKCWINMRHDKSKGENEVQQNFTETKVCSVFLKDVLKDTQLKETNICIVDHGNTKHLTTNKITKNENHSDNVISDTKNNVSGQRPKRTVSEVANESEQTSNEHSSTKKLKVSNVKSESDVDSKKPQPSTLQKSETNTRITKQSIDSDSSVLRRRKERSLTRQKRATGSSLSDADIGGRRNRKKLRNILEGISIIKNLVSTDDSSSNEDVTPNRRLASTSPTPIENRNRKRIFKRSRSLRMSRKIFNKKITSSSVNASQGSQSSEYNDKETMFDSTTYTCDECGASYENKLVGLTHKLTHYKRLKLKLKKLRKEDIAKKCLTPGEVINEQIKVHSKDTIIKIGENEEELVKEVNNLTKSNAEDEKEVIEDIIDVEFVAEESNDNCNLRVEKNSESQEEKIPTVLTNSLTRDETELKPQDSRACVDTNECNYDNIYEQTEAQNINSKVKQITLPSNAQDLKKEGYQKKDEPGKNTEDSENRVNNVNEDKSKRMKGEAIEMKTELKTGKGLTGLMSRESSTIDVVHEDQTDHSKHITQNIVEKKNGESEGKVEISEQESSKCLEKMESCNSNEGQTIELNNTSTKPINLENFMLSEKSDIVDEKDTEINDVNISKSDILKQERLNDSTNMAVEILQEVIDLASTEIQKRNLQTVIGSHGETNSTAAAALDNISQEI